MRYNHNINQTDHQVAQEEINEINEIEKLKKLTTPVKSYLRVARWQPIDDLKQLIVQSEQISSETLAQTSSET